MEKKTMITVYLIINVLILISKIETQTIIIDDVDIIIANTITASNMSVSSLSNYRLCFSIEKLLLDTLLNHYDTNEDGNKTSEIDFNRFDITIRFPREFKPT